MARTTQDNKLQDKNRDIKWTNINSLNINLQLCAAACFETPFELQNFVIDYEFCAIQFFE